MASAASITYGMGARVFWAYAWRTFLFVFPLVFVLVLLEKFVPFSKWMRQALNMGLGIAVAFYVLGLVFNKQYRRFSVQLVDNATGAPAERSFATLLPLWWAMTWRQYLLGMLICVPLIFTVMPFVKLAPQFKVEALCKQQVALFQQFKDLPNAAEQLKPVAETFRRLHCDTALKEAQSPERQRLASRFLLSCVVVTVLGMLLSIKVFQILLGKRFAAVQVVVTGRDNAALPSQ